MMRMCGREFLKEDEKKHAEKWEKNKDILVSRSVRKKRGLRKELIYELTYQLCLVLQKSQASHGQNSTHGT